jgi:hypothetical protein
MTLFLGWDAIRTACISVPQTAWWGYGPASQMARAAIDIRTYADSRKRWP